MDTIDHLANELSARLGLKTIVLTWDDMRPGHHGDVLAALSIKEGTDADLNAALRHAHAYGRDHCFSMRVHTFAPNNPQWKQLAIEAHKNGCGL